MTRATAYLPALLVYSAVWLALRGLGAASDKLEDLLPPHECYYCRHEPDALSPCPCSHAPCAHDANAADARARECEEGGEYVEAALVRLEAGLPEPGEKAAAPHPDCKCHCHEDRWEVSDVAGPCYCEAWPPSGGPA